MCRKILLLAITLLPLLSQTACSKKNGGSTKLGNATGVGGGDPDYGAAVATQAAIVKTLALIQSHDADPLNTAMDPVVEASNSQFGELYDPVRSLSVQQRTFLLDLL